MPESNAPQEQPGLAVPPVLAQNLDGALCQALPPPTLPPYFRPQLMAALQAQSLRDLTAQRQALEEEHRRAMAALHSGQRHLQRDTLALVVVVAFTAGSAANLALPWLNATTGVDSAVSVPLIAMAIGLVSGFRVWWERLGPFR